MRVLVGLLILVAVIVVFVTVFNVPPVLASLIGGFCGAIYAAMTRHRKHRED